MQGENERNNDVWRRRSKNAVTLSIAGSVLGLALYGAGVAVYFADFSFASGGDERGSVLMWVALAIAAFTFGCDIVGIAAGVIAFRATKTCRWFVVAVVLLAIKVGAIFAISAC